MNLAKNIGLCFSTFILVLCGVTANAQNQKRIPRVGMLFIGGQEQPHLESFKQGLREHGYTDGKNIILQYKYAHGKPERLPSLAAELVRENLDVIVTTASNSAHAVRQRTKAIPIVMTSGNPLEMGLAASLARPGGNVTGLTVMLSDLSGKRLEILKELLPKMANVGVLWRPQDIEEEAYKTTLAAAEAFSLNARTFEISSATDVAGAFRDMKATHIDGLVVILSPTTTLNSRRIVALAANQRLPGVYPTRQFAEEGGLMAYGPLIGDLYRRAASYVDKILKGANPADLPVEQPTKFEFIVNVKTANQIGLTIPSAVLARAHRVIR